MDFDLVVRGGLVFDGSGTAPFVGDIGLRDGKIAAIGQIAGRGVEEIDASDRNGPVVGIALVMEGDEVMLITDRGQTIRTTVSEIRETGRNAQGVKVMSVEEGERVVAIEAMSESSSGLDDESLMPPEIDGGSEPPSGDTGEASGGEASGGEGGGEPSGGEPSES